MKNVNPLRGNLLQTLINQAERYIELGVYDQQELFNIIYPLNRPVHYATVRRAVHIAKTR